MALKFGPSLVSPGKVADSFRFVSSDDRWWELAVRLSSAAAFVWRETSVGNFSAELITFHFTRNLTEIFRN